MGRYSAPVRVAGRPAAKAAIFLNRARLPRAALLASVAVAVLSQPAAADTLGDAMSLAYGGNPNLLAARAQLRAVDENVPVALSGWRPTLQLSGTVTRQRITNSSVANPNATLVPPSSFLSDTSRQGIATFTQPLFRGFRTVAQTSQAQDQVQAQRARLAGTEAQVLLQVATAYLDVIQNQSVVELNMNNVQLLSRQLDATNDRFRVGEITRTDVAQSEASLAGARASLVQAEGLLQQSRAAYENVVGKAPENLVQPMLPANLPKSLDDAVGAAIASNPNYVAADFTARAADDNVNVARGVLLPSASLVAQYTKGYDTSAVGARADTAVVQGQLTVPLYQQGAEYAQLRQAKDTAGQQHLLADQARLDARNAATVAWEALQSTTASLDSFKAQIAANEISVEGLQRQQEVGSATILDVLIQEQNLLNARVNLVRTLHDQSVAAYQLLSSVGSLSGGGIGLNVPLYDPTRHYNDVKFQAFGWNDQSDDDGDLKNRPKAPPAAMKGGEITQPPATPSTQPKPPSR